MFCKNITCLSVVLLRICQVLSVSRKTVYRWVMTNCCFMSDILEHTYLQTDMVFVMDHSVIICCIQVSDIKTLIGITCLHTFNF